MRRLIRTLSWLGVGFIAALAFWVSYHAIKDVWIEIGAGRPQDAWAIPLLIDGLIVVASLTALARSLDGVRTIYAWVLVGVSCAVSLGANIAHAAPALGPRVLAGMVPLILLAAAELVVREVLRTRAVPGSAHPEALPGTPPTREMPDATATRPAHTRTRTADPTRPGSRGVGDHHPSLPVPIGGGEGPHGSHLNGVPDGDPWGADGSGAAPQRGGVGSPRGGVIYSSPDEAWGAEGPFGYRRMMTLTGLKEYPAKKQIARLKAGTNGGVGR